MFGQLCNTYCVTSVLARDADTREHHRKRFNRGGIDCAPKAANDEGARPIAILANMYAAYAKTVRGNRRHAKAGGLARYSDGCRRSRAATARLIRWIACDDDARPLRAAVEKVERVGAQPLR